MNQHPHWDYSDLTKRLLSAKQAAWPSPQSDLYKEAADVIAALTSQNKILHRRAQATEGPSEAELMRLRYKAKWATDWALQANGRMSNAFQEIKTIYHHLRRAKPDGCDDYGYHSVMDSRADDGPSVPGAIWANKFKTRRGGIVSVRAAEIVGPLVDELLELRRAKAVTTLFARHRANRS